MTESSLDPATIRFTPVQKVRGLLVASVVAWLLSLAAMYGSSQFFEIIEQTMAGGQPRLAGLDNAIGWTLTGALYLGMPAALVIVLAFGFPGMSHAERTGATGFRDAAVFGVIVGAIVGVVVAIFVATTNRYDFPPLEWTKLGVDVILTMATGLVTGLSARLAAGRPKAAAHSV